MHSKTNLHPLSKIIATGVAVSLTTLLYAKPISLQEAQNVAVNWLTLKTGKEFHVKSISNFASAVVQDEEKNYRIIPLEPKGWVIVSSDDIARPIIGYGQSRISLTSLPPAFVSWMDGINEQIKYMVSSHVEKSDSKLSSAKSISSLWNRLKQDPSKIGKRLANKFGSTPTYKVKPLLWIGGNNETSGITWGQGKYYNVKTPDDSSILDGSGHAATGCVATAMGQVMRYYQVPSVGRGSYSYDDTTANGYQHDYGTLSANFGATTYQWDKMPTKLTDGSSAEEVDAVSTLLYHAGVAVAMDYGTGNGDGGSLSVYDPNSGPSATKAMHDYFGYTTEYIVGYDYTYSAWKNKLISSLENGNPILYGGSGGGGGHAFVLDGYGHDNDSGDDVFHFNWGWSGELNGAFSLLSITPGTYNDFSYGQQAVLLSGVAIPNYGVNSGGGCTYNPHNNGVDIIMILMLLLATLYPLGRRHLR